MKPSWFQTRFRVCLLLAFFVTGCVHATEPVFSDPQLNNVTGNSGQAPQQEAEDSAMVVHIDPKTGEIITPPASALSGQGPRQPVDASKKPPAELRETLSPVPGGGVMIDLQGRFRSPLVATQGADGKVSVEHTPVAPDSSEKK